MFLFIFFGVDHFKGLIEFVTILLLFYVLVSWPWGTWDFNSPTKERTGTLCIGRSNVNHQGSPYSWDLSQIWFQISLLLYKTMRTFKENQCLPTDAILMQWSTSSGGLQDSLPGALVSFELVKRFLRDSRVYVGHRIFLFLVCKQRFFISFSHFCIALNIILI